jgi:hypothetical protein
MEESHFIRSRRERVKFYKEYLDKDTKHEMRGDNKPFYIL